MSEIERYSVQFLQSMERALGGVKNPRFREYIRNAIDKGYAGDFSDLKYAANLKFFPVGVEEFIASKHYLNAADNVWPKVMEHLIEINSGEYVEALLTGGIGVAKTTIAVYTTAYQTYLLSALRNPQKMYGLDPASEIEFIFQNMNVTLAKAVDYARFRMLLANSEYFNKSFRFDKRVESEMRFPNNIIIKPVGGSAAGAIGQNVMGGVIDELNFMSVIENSKQSADKGTYDQAVEIYDSLSRRRKSRFMKQGKMPGILCLVSSKRYPGQFTDLKAEDAAKEKQRTGKTSVYVYDKRSWDVKPEGSFSGNFFPVYVGSESRKPIIVPPEQLNDYTADEIVEVPEEYRGEFERDIMGSLRDIAGVSTLARFPYIMEPDSITACMTDMKSVFSAEYTDFVTDKLMVLPKRLHKPELPRFVHVDLAVTGDSAGFAVGTISGFDKIDRGGENGIEVLPHIHIDGVLEIKPPKNGEILFHKVRSLIYTLKKVGLNIQWVTFDTYQSKDSMQLLHQQGYTVGNISTDTSMIPYDVTKLAFYDKRVTMPQHQKVKKEFISLEKDAKKGKIDHPANGSKDCSDAVASIIYGLTYRRQMWALYGIPLNGNLADRAAKSDKSMGEKK